MAMNRKELFELFCQELEVAKDVMNSKNRGYGKDEEALHNFFIGAQLQDSSLQQALGGYLAKHIVSVYDLINGGLPVDSPNLMEIWHEKITDSIVYLGILHAICVNEFQWYMTEQSEKALNKVDKVPSNTYTVVG